MPGDLGRAAREIAGTLRAGRKQAWLVGGAVRDHALGRTPKDVDLATDATPDEIERAFPEAKGVGRAFGTMLVAHAGVVAQVTTYRSESGYSDARRPDRVAFGRSAREDAQRRDFTCNALYLDPLSDELFDPTAGLADLERGVLRAVGRPQERFREDGLRLLRLARFAGALGLRVEPDTLQAARLSVEAIAGVSGERVLAELSTMFVRPRAATGLELLHDIEVLPRASAGLDSSTLPEQIELMRRVGDPVGVALGWTILLARTESAAGVLDRLHPSNELKREIVELRAAHEQLSRHARAGHIERSALVRLVRQRAWNDALRLACATAAADSAERAALEDFRRTADALDESELRPRPWLASRDLAEVGVPRGPRWRELLLEAETLQLNGVLASREKALEWLRRAWAARREA